MKKSFVLLLASALLLFGMTIFVHAEPDIEVVPTGDYTIMTNGIYQLSEDYSGTITVSSAVYEVTVTDAVYKAAHFETGIVIEEGRTEALELTIEDLDISADLPDAISPVHFSGIDFGGAGSFGNKLYISGICSIEGSFYGQAGIHVPEGVELTIDRAESLSDDEPAELMAAGGRYGAGIGGSNEESGGTINIVGGTVTATSKGFAAGIGGGTYGSGGNINISGGIVTASDEGSYGAAIGGGWEGTGGSINISGGKVRAIGTYGGAGIGGGMKSYSDKVGDADGGNITISGGEVIATVGGPGAAIGGGWGGSAGNITISGGTVTATAFSGAGIGNGMGGVGGSINISGGIVNVVADSAGAGIGGGGSGTAGSITISGGEVTVAGSGTSGAGIGGGSNEDGGNIDISGGTIIVTGGMYAAGIGGGSGGNSGNITISGGTVEATGGMHGAGIGGGLDGSGDNLTITGGNVKAISLFGGAGIGGGNNDSSGGVNDGGNITINGGNVRAISGGYGAGIGGGNEGSGGNITINGGSVEASCEVYGANTGQGAYGAGIGGGSNRNHPHYADDIDNNGGTITINDGTVTAKGGGMAAGIGGGEYGEGGTVIINGGTVEAYGGSSGAGIGGGMYRDGGTVAISGGSVKATGGYNAAGIGGGSNGTGADVTISGTPSVVSEATEPGWNECPARPIGNGGGWSELDPGTLRHSTGYDLSYLLFNTSEMADVKIKFEGTENNDGEYLSDEQGVFWMFVPYSEGDTYSYTMSKAGYAAVEGSRALPVASDAVNIELAVDNTKPDISEISPSAAGEGANVTVACNDYGLYGTVYLVEKVDEIYTSKAGLEYGYLRKVPASASASISTLGLAEGYYEVYLTDSAENVSDPKDLVMDYTKPVVSNNSITATGVTHNGVTLAWNKASDNHTVDTDLEYIIYRSLVDNLGSVEGIEANGTVVTNEDIIGDTAFAVTGLRPNTKYYLNIIVSDMAGNRSCYSTIYIKTNKQPSTSSGSSNTPAPSTTGLTQIGTERYAYEFTGAWGSPRRIESSLATVLIPSDMLTAEMLGESKTAEFLIGKADISVLPAGLQAKIGDRPVIELSLRLDGKTVAWNNPNAPVTVSIPYVPTAEELENPENITVWYIDGEGKAISVPSGRYDPATGMVTFTTSHFSSFAIVFVSRSFNDIGVYGWAEKQIKVLTAKDIMDGRTESLFEPSAGITRAEYIAALVRAMGVTAKTEGSFKDVGIGSRYYNEIAVAKQLGIAKGTGNGSFGPEMIISRQDMLVLTERALRGQKRISGTGTAKDLEKYTDKDTLADYAVQSIAALVSEGLVEGSNGRLNVRADATRAEAAVFLYRIYNLK